MKEININIEGFNENGICVGCLNYNRKMFRHENVKSCYKLLADIDVPDGLDIQVCWECFAAVRNISLFQAQILKSFNYLLEYSQKQTFLNSPTDLTQYSTQRLSATNLLESCNCITSQMKSEDPSDDIKVKLEDSNLIGFDNNEDEVTVPLEDIPVVLDELKIEQDYEDINYSDEIDLFPEPVSSDDDIQLSKLKKKEKKNRKKKKIKSKAKSSDESEPSNKIRQSRRMKNLPEDLVQLFTMDEEEMWKIRAQDLASKEFTKRKYRCDDCIIGFNTQKLMNDHMNGKHKPKSGECSQCDICKAYFLSKDNLSAHKSLHLVAFSCTACAYRTSAKRSMADHCTQHSRHPLYQCNQCQDQFTTRSKLNYHRNVTHQSKPQCDCCGKVFANKMTLKYHLKTAYNHTMADQPDEPMDLMDLPLPSKSNVLTDLPLPSKSNVLTVLPLPVLMVLPLPSRSNVHTDLPLPSRSNVLTDLPLSSRSNVHTDLPLSSRSNVNTDLPLPSRSNVHTDLPLSSRSNVLTDLPLPSRSNVLTESALTSATPIAEPPTIAARKSKAQKQREYRQRIAASRTPAQAIAARKSDAERHRRFRLRKAANSALVSGSLESTTASTSRSRSNVVQRHQQGQTSAAEPAQITIQPGTSTDTDQIEVNQAQSTWNTKWASSIMRFESTFLDNDFGYACSVCDRLWFKNDLKPITAAQLEVISEWYIKENRRLCREEYEMVCNTCKRTLNKKSMPPLAKVNGFSYPDQPPGLPPLDPISERLISPRLPFTQVRRLRHDLSCGIIAQVINVPDEHEMVKYLPRQLNEDDVINVNIKRNLAHKSAYISGYMSKSTISAWLTVLQKSPLYRLYEINVEMSRLQPTVPFLDEIQDDPSNRIENISAENTPESEILASRQHTLMWNEEDCLNIARGYQATPPYIIYDNHAEELSFPSIYFGEPRQFNKGVSVSPYMIAISEIRRRDRRGATPQKILYVAMKILLLRMVNGIYSTFRNVSATDNVTRRMLEDPEFLKEYVNQNLAFMKSVPNSVQYWASRKRDLFAIIRQLGKPTVFLTISANEIRWMKLLTILLKLSKKYPGKTAKDLNTSERCTLVGDDPVTCCIYFYKLVGSLMKMLKSKQTYNPFGKYFVKDYFLRIEFQHQGSPHAHILLWLNDDPRETVSEHMPRTIELVEKISSVARDDVPDNSIYANQIHKHTFTCTKRGEAICRFGIPYWPMPTTRVLVPIPESDGRRQTLQQKANELRSSLSEHRYACMDEFLNANGLTEVSYVDIVRSTLRTPTLVFRRNFDELMTNTFNPYLAGEVNSNIDIQFILDEYSCAEYIVEYVNKSARGMGDLCREVTTMIQEHPQGYTGQLKALSTKLVNAVEMSAQEAAWYLLRQPMSETSCPVVYIPTVWPNERQRQRKRRQQMDREGIDGDSTDVWTKNIIQRYEERPVSLERVYLAEFASWYANANDFVGVEDDVPDDDEDSEAVPEAGTSRAPREYRRRLLGRVIRYRRYDIDDTVNYKREMVLLYVQFRNEMSEIVDRNNFLQLFDDNKDMIMERRSLFETNLNIENVTKELEAMMILQNDDNNRLPVTK